MFTECSDDRLVENKSLPSSADEGFEDSRSGDFTKSPPLSQIPFIDFRKPKNNRREKVIYFYENVLLFFTIYVCFALFFAEYTKISQQRSRIVRHDKVGCYGMVDL